MSEHSEGRAEEVDLGDPAASINPEEVVELARALVRLPSENPPGNEELVARVLGEFLSTAGLDVAYREVFPGRPNLIATLHGNAAGPVLLYTGHTDTMPVSGVWAEDPHSGAIRDGRLWGRGAVDMKGGLAAMAVAAASLRRSGIPLRGSLLFAAVIDEEKGGAGTRQLVRDGVHADWAVISEPTNNVPVIVSNGQLDFEVILQGRSGHASSPAAGHNAIYDAMDLVRALRELMANEFPVRDYPLVGPPSLSVGTIEGGIQTSVIPDRCRVTVDRRVVPSETTAGAIEEMEAVIERLRRSVPGFDAALDVFVRIDPVTISAESPIVRALRHAAASVTGVDPGVAGLRATTDADTLANQGGIPTVIMGPGSIREAHKADEFIPVDQLVAAAQLFALAAVDLLG